MGQRNTFLKTLNGGGVPSPQPQRGRVSRSWCPSSVRTILRNERYRGLVVWGRTRRYARQKLAGVFIVLAQRTNGYIPAQRIVSEELWHRVHERRDLVKRAYIAAQKPKGLLNSAALNSSYLFSGLLKCGECGANRTVLWGRGGTNPVRSTAARPTGIAARRSARIRPGFAGTTLSPRCWRTYRKRSCGPMSSIT